MKSKFGIPWTTTDYHEIMDSEEIDLELVLTSMNKHAKITKAALKVGNHVLVENQWQATPISFP